MTGATSMAPARRFERKSKKNMGYLRVLIGDWNGELHFTSVEIKVKKKVFWPQRNSKSRERSQFFWCLFSCTFPILPWLLYLQWRRKCPFIFWQLAHFLLFWSAKMKSKLKLYCRNIFTFLHWRRISMSCSFPLVWSRSAAFLS